MHVDTSKEVCLQVQDKENVRMMSLLSCYHARIASFLHASTRKNFSLKLNFPPTYPSLFFNQPYSISIRRDLSQPVPGDSAPSSIPPKPSALQCEWGVLL